MEELLLGLSEIDEDHLAIYKSFEKLNDPTVYNDTMQRILAVEDFVDYSTTHLDKEEQLMRKINYPGYMAHREAHRDLQDNFMALVKDVLKGNLTQAKALQEFKRIFLTHTSTVDKALVDWANTPKKKTPF